MKAEQHKILFAGGILPIDLAALFKQLVIDFYIHRLGRIFALAKDDMIACLVNGYNIDLRVVSVPPSADSCGDKIPCAFRHQIRHIFPTADIFIYECRVIGDKSLLDFLHDKVGIVHFNIGTVGIDEFKPEADIVVLDPIQAHLALFKLAFRHRHFTLQNIQVNQHIQIFRKAGGFHFQCRSDFIGLLSTRSNRFDDRKVTAYVLHLFFQQEIGFLIQVAFPRHHTVFDCLIYIGVKLKGFDVFRNAARYRVVFNELLFAESTVKFMVISKGDLLHFDLSRSPAIERTIVGQRLRIHHIHQ